MEAFKIDFFFFFIWFSSMFIQNLETMETPQKKSVDLWKKIPNE